MTCKQIDAFLDQQWSGPGTPVPRNVAGHLESCAACRRLFRSLAGSATDRQPSAQVQSQIERAVIGSLEPVEPLAPARKFTFDLLAVFVLIAAAVAAIVGVRAPWRMTGLQFAALTSALLVGAALLAVSLSRQVSPGARYRIPPKALVLSVAIAFLCLSLLLLPWRMTNRFWSWGLMCFSFGSVLAAVATIPLWMLVRRGAILSPALTGATTGLLAGLLSATVVHLGCANTTAPHVALWHAAVPIFSALVGFWLGNHSRRHPADGS